MRSSQQILIGLATITVGAIAYGELSGSTTPTTRPVVRPRRATIQTAKPSPRSGLKPFAQNPAPLILPQPEIRNAGLAIEDGRVVIESYDAWMQYAPAAIEGALADGARGTDGILIHVMRRALPRHRWPPELGSPIAQQWPQMLQQVAEKLGFDPDPEPSRLPNRLRLL